MHPIYQQYLAYVNNNIKEQTLIITSALFRGLYLLTILSFDNFSIVIILLSKQNLKEFFAKFL